MALSILGKMSYNVSRASAEALQRIREPKTVEKKGAMDTMDMLRTKKGLLILFAMIIATVFLFILSNWVMSENYVNQYTQAIDRNRDTVLKLMASSTAASAAITALPGDVATPIATELAELSKGFLIVLCALYLEKFLVAVCGTVAFQWLIPVACGVVVVGIFSKKAALRAIGFRMVAISLALVLVVPASVKLSGMIENSYRDSIDQVIASAQSSAEQIQGSVNMQAEQEESSNGLGKIIDSLMRSGDIIVNGASQLMEYFENLMSRFVESMAIMLVISCLIPLLVLLFFAWMVKSLLHLSGRH